MEILYFLHNKLTLDLEIYFNYVLRRKEFIASMKLYTLRFANKLFPTTANRIPKTFSFQLDEIIRAESDP